MTYTADMSWKIKIPTKVGKQIIKLPRAAQAATLLLIRDLEKKWSGDRRWLEKLWKTKGHAW